jgi:hypothetical protein
MQQRHSSFTTVTAPTNGRPLETDQLERAAARSSNWPATPRGDCVIAARCGKPANCRGIQRIELCLEPLEPSATAVILVAIRTLVRPYL